MPRTALILVAAGKGERAGGDIPKQYRLLSGKPLLHHTLFNLQKAYNFDVFCVVIRPDDKNIRSVLADLCLDAKIITGGQTRTESVRNGLRALENSKVDHVYIHDAARPFVSRKLLSGLAKALLSSPAAAPVLPISDALKTLSGEAVDREGLRRVQTPQAFHYSEILQAFNALPTDESRADDIAVAQEKGLAITLTQGDERNFKLTYPADFAKAEQMMQTDSYIATGSGFDVHQFEEGNPLWLCGVSIDCGFTLKGHSDADAGLHALTDALLGALAYGDIGDHFPPSDPKWKGAASDKFLLFALEKMAERGGVLQHVDVTLICEKPKIKPHREKMRERIAELCQLPLTRVSVKATTTEKLGFAGRGEGLAAQAVATVKLPL
ncbi:bifunctional 2-C-methyl-D-erythritol 4-phosphate cytidylyltransferase/2-C-methyl-D-erythritol 2,4-cyclodiphosphate synthase [Litorimonas haliclonae]|uniref:bifunctional 2-C-methyl-D-erythritol 4-phosphate cytidylyltransferase/2-C-methyl-D-erythritol 2,4-cyclodiphosphate synthase n=1 Tax=Litorimonas haliclonae TaxID=2081977 RepID=UPI0039EE23F2